MTKKQTFLHQGEYICKCGKKFDNSQAFNGHKSHCKRHLKSKGKAAIIKHKIAQKKFLQKGLRTKAQKYKIKKQEESAVWIKEKHTCEKCGKIMTKKFGSGRFCPRSCANSTSRTRTPKGTYTDKMKAEQQKRRQNRLKVYYKNPNYCQICGKIIDYDKRYNKTCSQKCAYKLISKKQLANHNNLNKKLIKGKYVEGRHILYKTVCDVDGSFYIGVHKCDDDSDKYLGKGVYLQNKIKKYGREHFRRETLKEFTNSEDAFKAEYKFINDKKLLLNKKCMNLAEGGYGGATHNSEQEYNRNPNRCKICKKALPYDKRNNITCGADKCIRKAHNW